MTKFGHLLLALLLGTVAAQSALVDRFGDLVKADGARSAMLPTSGVRITYLGTNAYLLESRRATILVDPYFSRTSLLRCALKLHTAPREDLVRQWLAEAPPLDGILVTHVHVDHLFDVPQILRQTGAPLYASERSVEIVASMKIPRGQLHVVHPGDIRRIGGATVHFLRATHDRVLGRVPFPDPPRHLPPRNVDDWTVGEPLAFLVEIGGKRIYMNSGSLPNDLPPANLGRIDLAIIGVATPDAVRALPGALERLRPALLLPSHQDDFFQPLKAGFRFLAGSNFPQVRRLAEERRQPLILLDYFQPWTLR